MISSSIGTTFLAVYTFEVGIVPFDLSDAGILD